MIFAQTNIAVGAELISIAAGDFNGDGYPDVVTANARDGTLSVLANDSTGLLSQAATLAVGGLSQVLAADLNGDGRPDIVCSGMPSLILFTNDGHGGFGAITNFCSSGLDMGPLGPIAIADFDRDGQPDIALSANGGYANVITIFTNRGNGLCDFYTAFGLDPTNRVRYLLPADFNGDGWPDLAYTCWSNSLAVFTNSTRAGFALSSKMALGSSVEKGFAALDLNDDSRLDLVYQDVDWYRLSGFTNGGRGDFSPAFSMTFEAYGRQIIATDLDGTGQDKLVVPASFCPTAQLAVFRPLPQIASFSGFFSGDGSLLTNLSFNNINGTIPAEKLPGGSVASLVADQTFTGANIFYGRVTATNAANLFAGSFSGNGAGLTNVLPYPTTAGLFLRSWDAGYWGTAHLTAWDIPNLSGTYMDRSTAQTVGGSNTFTDPLVASNPQNVLAGNGVGITGVNAATLSGTLFDARLSANVALRYGGNTFNGDQSVTGGSLVLDANQLLNFSPANKTVYDGKTRGFYSLGWFTDSWNASAPTAWLSSWGGLKLFTSGTDPVLSVTSGGRVGLGTQTPAGGLHITSAPGWSSYNFGVDLLIDGWRNNGIGILDSNSGNPWAIANAGGSLVFSQMPPLGDTTTAPTTRFTIAADGTLIGGALDIKGVVSATSFIGSAAGLTGIPSAALPANVAYLDANQTFSGPLTFNSTLSFYANLFLNDKDLYLRNDINHGLGWYGGAKTFGGVGVDRPILYGYSGGGLGTLQSGSATNLALQWDGSGKLMVDPGSLNSGSLTPGLTFGWNSGEGIASRRSAGGNQYGLDFYTYYAPRLSIANNGYVGIGTTSPTHPLHMASGAYCTGYQWVNTSDRNAKENFVPIDSRAVLDKLAGLAVNTWNYRTETNAVRHLGPTAQDFHAAFGLGDSDTTIGTVDESGVAVAAIQGLNQKLETRDAALHAENAELKQQLAELKILISQLTTQLKGTQQ